MLSMCEVDWLPTKPSTWEVYSLISTWKTESLNIEFCCHTGVVVALLFRLWVVHHRFLSSLSQTSFLPTKRDGEIKCVTNFPPPRGRLRVRAGRRSSYQTDDLQKKRTLQDLVMSQWPVFGFAKSRILEPQGEKGKDLP